MRTSLRWCAMSTVSHEASRTAVTVTRLGPSTLLPHMRGVFTTRPLKALTTLTILPKATHNATDCSDNCSSVQAPPYLCNLATAPRHRISLRRFCALRHQFSSDRFFHITSDVGWYLLAPSDHAALPDVSGLQGWMHKAQLTSRTEEDTTSDIEGNTATGNNTISTSNSVVRSHADWRRRQLMVGETSERTIHKLAKRKARDIMDEYLFLHGEDDNINDSVTMEDVNESQAQQKQPHKPTTTGNSSKRLVIPEEHLFEINDGVPWELPPQDDLASVSYWKEHRTRMSIYESDGGLTVEDHEAFVLHGIHSPTTERESNNTSDNVVRDEATLAAREALFQAYTNKANVSLQVDDHTGLVTLTPLVDLAPQTELFLHYGREWWTTRLLAPVLLAVSDAQMHQVRWIEALCSAANDVAQPFPRLVPVCHKATGAKVQQWVLGNAVTRRRASDAAVLAFAVRRSCTDVDFYHALLHGYTHPGLHSTVSVFDVAQPDAEVPMRRLRRALLYWLRAEATHRTSREEAMKERDEAEVQAVQDLLSV